uniref:Protein scarlet n=1 Tax=Cacopsylla melanoneura TaxID=428564 RepID=A0A8D9C0I3_9HEMI
MEMDSVKGESFALENYAGVHRKKIYMRSKSKSEQPPGFTLSWSSLSVYCVNKKTSFFSTKVTTKKLVNNVTGVARAGTLTAVMGASGAGKTTLLSALAQRNNGGLVVEGDVRVNGVTIGSKIRKISAFLYQKDLFTPTLTVYEHLVFYARLKLDRRLSKTEIKDKVFDILRQVGLLGVANRQIGTSGDHVQIFLSGGEKRRLSFATEMLSDPDLFFCDEVTSGLDSYSTLHLVSTMKQMCSEHQKTIVCSIHQPSSELLYLFDSLIILAESRTAFIGTPDSAVEFLKTHGYECPLNFNPADFFIKILAITADDEQNSRKRIKQICDAYVSSETAQSIDTLIHGTMTTSDSEPIRDNSSNIKPTTWLTKFLLVTYRLEVGILRNRQYLILRVMQKVLIGLMLGSIYSGTLTQDQLGIQAMEGLFYMIVLENVFPSVFSSINKFQSQVPLFVRDYEDGLVSTLQFYTAMCVAWFPIMVFESIVITSSLYLLAGAYVSLDLYIDTLYICAVTSVLSMVCGMAFSASIDSYEICSFVLGEFIQLTNICAGFYMSLRTIPVYLKFFEFVSWERSSVELLSIIHIQGITDYACSNRTGIELPCLQTGAQVLNQYGYSPANFTWDFVSMYLLMAAFYLLGYGFFFRRILKITTV